MPPMTTMPAANAAGLRSVFDIGYLRLLLRRPRRLRLGEVPEKRFPDSSADSHPGIWGHERGSFVPENRTPCSG